MLRSAYLCALALLFTGCFADVSPLASGDASVDTDLPDTRMDVLDDVMNDADTVDTTPDPPDTTPMDAGCMPIGTTRCGAGALETCNAMGGWDSMPCDDCIMLPGGDAICGACTPGTTMCAGTTILVCTAMGELETTPCMDTTPVCLETAGVPSCVECVEGEVRCDGMAPEICNAAGAWEANGATCPIFCFDGACQECAPETVVCADGDTLSTCDATGSFVDSDCSGGAPLCTSAITPPRCVECEPNNVRCDGSDLVTCDAAGVETTVACGALGCDSSTTPPSCRTCEDGETRCAGDALETCSGGEFTSTPCDTLGCDEFGGVAACARFVPSNVGDDFVPDPGATGTLSLGALYGVADGRDRLIVNVNDGTITADEIGPFDERIVVRDDSALDQGIHYQVIAGIAVFTAANINIGAGEGLWFIGSRPVAFIATEEIVIDGEVYAGATGISGAYTGGPGGGNTGGFCGTTSGVCPDGRGMGPGAGGANRGDNVDGGGGGGGFGSAGGEGGRGAGGSGGMTYGNMVLIPLLGGSGGGTGGDDDGGPGGAGGGAIQFSAFGALRVSGSGSVNAPGGGGFGGEEGGADGGAGGGGGSGGGIILESPNVTIRGAVGVPGGGGAAGWRCSGGCGGSDDPGAGGTTLRELSGMASGGEGVSPEGASGGDGHFSGTTVAESGSGGGRENGGGGGGGAGRIRVNARTLVSSGTFVPNDASIQTSGDVLSAPAR